MMHNTCNCQSCTCWLIANKTCSLFYECIKMKMLWIALEYPGNKYIKSITNIVQILLAWHNSHCNIIKCVLCWLHLSLKVVYIVRYMHFFNSKLKNLLIMMSNKCHQHWILFVANRYLFVVCLFCGQIFRIFFYSRL